MTIQKGQHLSLETEFKKGHIPWDKGIKRLDISGDRSPTKRPEVRKKLSKSLKQKQEDDPKYREWLSTQLKKYHWKKLGLNPWNKGIPCREETKRKIGEKNKINTKRNWQIQEYREKVIRNSLKALLKRPTKLEQKFIKFCKKYSLPFRYCGNGSLLVGYKNPDFVESNEKKMCIETANYYHHQGNWSQKRIEHFARYGWKCLVLWEEEFKDEQSLLNKIKVFING